MQQSATRIAWYSPHGGMPARALMTWCRYVDTSRTLVLAPTDPTRDLWLTRLAHQEPQEALPRVLSWSDLWCEIRRASTTGPRVIDEPGWRLIVERSIDACLREGRFAEAKDVVQTSGFRRRLGAKFETWSSQGFRSPVGRTNIEPDEWSAFQHARRLMARARVTDRAGLARWASRSHRPSAWFDQAGIEALAVIDASRIGPFGWSVLEGPGHRRISLAVSLPDEPEPKRDEVFHDVVWCRDRLDALGFEFQPTPSEPQPSGLATIGESLFRSGKAPASDCTGVRLEGMPEGFGESLAAARAVRRAVEQGAAPDEILVVFPDWGDLSRETTATLRAWGVPCSGGPKLPLIRDAGVACLVTAAELPTNLWETRILTSLLRHGRLAPRWADANALADAARAMADCRVYRDPDRIFVTLTRRTNADARDDANDRRDALARRRAATAIDALRQLTDLFEDETRTWDDCVARLDRIITSLGLDRTDIQGAVEALRAAASTRGELREAIGQGRREWTWGAFAIELKQIAREVHFQPDPTRPGTVRLATIDESWGADVSWRVVVGASEGTFPTRAVVRSTWTSPRTATIEADDWIEREELARQMRRFLDLACGTSRELTLIHASADEKGHPLLHAGFVDELENLFTPEAWLDHRAETSRFGAVLDSELAIAPRERRVRAMSRALEGSPHEWIALAGQPRESRPLAGMSLGLRVIQSRSRGRFGPHDGVLTGLRTIRAIADEFDRRAAVLSPSQLETYAFCPFRYYLRYVLNAQPEAAHELEEDLAERGRTLHRILEEFHRILHLDDTDSRLADADSLKARLARLIDAQVDQAEEAASEIEHGLRLIDQDRITLHCRTYIDQYMTYLAESPSPVPVEFELGFGRGGDLPPLRLGPDSRGKMIGVQGIVDRIDEVRVGDSRYFRVIDYKSGAVPGSGDLRSGQALQLPLYLLAVGRLHYDDGSVRPGEMGYWGLKEGVGYKKLNPWGRGRRTAGTDPQAWESFAQRLERFVLELADRIRSGEFPVAPGSEDCERSCDFRTACRVRQLRSRGKAWDRQPTWDPAGKPES